MDIEYAGHFEKIPESPAAKGKKKVRFSPIVTVYKDTPLKNNDVVLVPLQEEKYEFDENFSNTLSCTAILFLLAFFSIAFIVVVYLIRKMLLMEMEKNVGQQQLSHISY